MSKVALSGNASGTGTFTIASPNSNTDQTLTLPDAAGTLTTSEAVAAAGYTTSAAVLTQFNATGSAPVYACRAWVNFNGTGTVAIRASGNVSSITDNGTGDYTVNFTTAMPDVNYSVIGSAGVGGFNGVYVTTQSSDGARGTNTTSSTQIRTLVGGNSSGGAYDASFVQVAIFR